MSNHGLTTDIMMQQFPIALQKDPKMIALAKAIANVLESRQSEIELCQVYAYIDKLPESLLDTLARDFAVDWYDYDYPLATKRRVIKSASYIHRHRGTVGAVLHGIRSIYPGSRVEEWWQYDGEPYHFRVFLDMGGSDISFISTDRVLWAISYYKSLRSYVDGVYYQSTFGIEVQTSTGYIIYAVRRCGTFPKTATQGHVTDGNIIIETDEFRTSYTSPYTGQLAAGTFPKVSTQGRIGNENVVVVTDEFGGSYAHPRAAQLETGVFPATATHGHTAASQIEVLTVNNGGAYTPEKLAGTYPETATQGVDDAGYIVVQTADSGSTYAAPASGDLTAGLHPATATSGGTSGGGLVAEESGLGVPYVTKVCGSTPGMNF